MRSLFFRNFIFTILQPGLVAGLIPFWILRDQWRFNEMTIDLLTIIGVVLFLCGLILMLYCIYLFATAGRGTLSPFDRTKNLVIEGVYRYSRNPMYVGVMLILIGETIITQSQNMLIYGVVVFIIFHLFILIVEEPRLRRDFGDSYDAYIKKTRRWL